MVQMALNKYVSDVKKSLKINHPEKNVFMFGLMGELGSIYSHIKKEVRDGTINNYAKEELEEELGDTLWYIVAICLEFEVKIDKVLINNLERIKNDPSIIIKDNPKLENESLSFIYKATIPKKINSFNEYQMCAEKSRVIDQINKDNLIDFCYPMTKISQDIYEIFYMEETLDLENRIGDLFWYLSILASHYEISMDTVAENNAKKIKGIFREKIKTVSKFFDDKYPNNEKLPKKFTVVFLNESSKVAYLVINGLAVGDPLDDNSASSDGYRYHDGIHFCIYALLGWSPVWRGFLRRKRKSNKQTDTVEDGARARIVEEMIVKLIHSYFHGVDTSGDKKQNSINFSFLKNIKLLTKGLEVEAISYSQWEEVILKSKEIYDLLHHNKGGKLHIRLDKRSIKYEELTDEDEKKAFL